MPREHPLARQAAVSLAELLRSPIVLYPRGCGSTFAESLMGILHRNACYPVVSQQAIEIHTALGLVGAGLGVSLVGKSVINNNRHDVVFKPFTDFECDSYLSTITSRVRKPSRATVHECAKRGCLLASFRP